jgi:hypothetical protein
MTDNIASSDGASDFDIEASVDFYSINGEAKELEDFSYQEIILGESLLTPGLQTSVICHSFKHTQSVKNFDSFKNANVHVYVRHPRFKDPFETVQTIYRLEDRSPLDNNNESLTFRACDPSMLYNAINLVSKSWSCTTPSTIVDYVLRSCVGAKNLDIEPSSPARDYIAENIHPFQVIKQQSNAAMAGGDDPSFLHYMTYRNGATHHFRSLKSLTGSMNLGGIFNIQSAKPVMKFIESQTGPSTGLGNPHSILNYTFPCDFDLLSDLLNGIGPNGENLSSVILFNEKSKLFSVIGNQTIGCGVGGGPAKLAKTNLNTAAYQNSCNDNIGNSLLLRQARMSLLENDKIALRMTVPFNPMLHVGDIIEAIFPNKLNGTTLNYGSGNYLILHMMHNIKRGGYATTTMSCVSQTAGIGIT